MATDIGETRLIVGTRNDRTLAIELNVSVKQRRPTSPRKQRKPETNDLNTHFSLNSNNKREKPESF